MSDSGDAGHEVDTSTALGEPDLTDRSLRLPLEHAAVAEARRLLADLLWRAGVSRVAHENAIVVLHEIATNAVDHGWAADGTFEVTWRRVSDLLELMVVDDGRDGEVAVQPLDLDHHRGRGLRMVDAFSSRWHVQRDDRTRVTAWVDLAAS